MSDGGDLEVYHFQGGDDEEVPETVEELIVKLGVVVLRKGLCFDRTALCEVTLPKGLIRIDKEAFAWCHNLLEISISSSVQYIGIDAFYECRLLAKVEFEFENSASSPHQLQTIGRSAFNSCTSLERMKLPPSVTSDFAAFHNCQSLIEANLSTTGVPEISDDAFTYCSSLQTVSLPNTLERIGDLAFYHCTFLVTVVVPLDSQSIRIGAESFTGCEALANLVLPKDSTAEEDSFTECDRLHERYGEYSSDIVTGLIGRFEDFSIQRMCYDHSLISTVQELRQCIAEQQEGDSLVDEFGMTPFHVFFSAAEPSIELLDVLLESLPYQSLLKLKDSTSWRPLDYLCHNWTDGTGSLVQRTLQKWMVDRLASWGATSWMEVIQNKVQGILEDHTGRRAILCEEVYSALEHYENIEGTSILEMALWKWKLKSGWTSDGSKRQALDRDECRCLSGSNVVIPHAAVFLGIRREEEEDD